MTREGLHSTGNEAEFRSEPDDGCKDMPRSEVELRRSRFQGPRFGHFRVARSEHAAPFVFRTFSAGSRPVKVSASALFRR